jgi:hypothetical protein
MNAENNNIDFQGSRNLFHRESLNLYCTEVKGHYLYD